MKSCVIVTVLGNIITCLFPLLTYKLYRSLRYFIQGIVSCMLFKFLDFINTSVVYHQKLSKFACGESGVC